MHQHNVHVCMIVVFPFTVLLGMSNNPAFHLSVPSHRDLQVSVISIYVVGAGTMERYVAASAFMNYVLSSKVYSYMS